MTTFLVIYVTYPSEEEATKICAQLLEKQLIACANIYPIQSMYTWEGEVRNEKEWISILKSTESNWLELQTTLTDLHAYDVPCITRWAADANTPYKNWIAENTK